MLQTRSAWRPIWLSVVLSLLAFLSDSHAQNMEESSTTKLVLLGTGTPNADPNRSGPAVAVVVNGSPYLVDFGPGVVRRVAAAQAAGSEDLEVTKLTRAFLSHLHSDHTVGYPDLIFTPWTLGREVPLEVYGPRGLKDMTDHILAAYEQDIRMRIDGLEPANPEGYKVNVHEVTSGKIYEDENVAVEAVAVSHGSWEQAFAYKFVTSDRIIVISGDAVPSESLIQAAKGCDILVHEVYSQAGFEKRKPEWQKYHASFHTSSKQLAEIAKHAQPRLLVLYHQLFWGVSEEELLAEIQADYDGKVVSGRDLDVFY